MCSQKTQRSAGPARGIRYERFWISVTIGVRALFSLVLPHSGHAGRKKVELELEAIGVSPSKVYDGWLILSRLFPALTENNPE